MAEWIEDQGFVLLSSSILAWFGYIDLPLRVGMRRSVRAVPGLVSALESLDSCSLVRLPAAFTTSLPSFARRPVCVGRVSSRRTSRYSQRACWPVADLKRSAKNENLSRHHAFGLYLRLHCGASAA